MAANPIPRLTVEQYLEIERASDTKHEYFAGHMYDMAGGSRNHARITTNFLAELSARVREGCLVYSSDMRVRTSPQGLHTYPDASVVCGEEVLAADTLLNPIALVEVLSKSTEAHDRGAKFAEYRRIEALRDYVLVSQTEPRVEVFSRDGNGKWVLNEFVGNDSVCRLPGVDCSIPLSAIYKHVKFETV